MAAKTLYDKLWDAHTVQVLNDGSALVYIDRHLIHEVTSPQAFEGLRLANRQAWRRDANLRPRSRQRGSPPVPGPAECIQVAARVARTADRLRTGPHRGPRVEIVELPHRGRGTSTESPG